ncbi:MAG: glutamate racemase, partial [Anaerolineaceae bacterium]|nr:glutamate racemase [Anaerolineaceae bacterium]
MIGVFDSGVGGLSILREIRNELPQYSYCYLADQTHVPYGARSYQEIQKFSVEISRWLISQGAKLIVVACNSASGAALQHLRQVFAG